MGVDFDGAAIEKSGFVTPLANGVEGGLIKRGVAFEELQGANGAVGGDEGVEFDAAFPMTGQRGVDRLDAMNEHGGVEVRYADDARRRIRRDDRLNATFADEFGTSDTFWTRVSGDIGVREVIFWARGDSGLRARGGHYRGACEAKRELVTAGDVRRARIGVIRSGGVIVGWDGHYVREGDAGSFGQDGEQNQRCEYGDLYEHGEQQRAAASAAGAMELIRVAVDEAVAQG